MRKLQWWHVALASLLAAGALAFWFFYEPTDDSDSTWELVLDGSSSPQTLERARAIVAARLVGTGATVRARKERLVVTLPHIDDLDEEFAAISFVDGLLRAPPARIEIELVDDGSVFMQMLTDRVRADRAAADLGIIAVTERRQVGGRTEVEHYLSAPDKGRYVNTAWALAHGCTDKYSVDRERTEGLGVYCIVKGTDFLRAYLAGDEDLGVPALEGFAVPADRALVFVAREGTARTHLVETPRFIVDPSTVADVTAHGRTLRATLTAPAAEALLARAEKRGIVAVFGDGVVPVQIARTGSSVELSIELADGARDLAYAFELGALPGRLRVLEPGKPR